MLVLLAISCVLGLSLVWLAHMLRVRKLVTNEVARKIVHLAHAMVVVGWPVFVGYWLVIVGELVFLAAVLAAQEYRIFRELRQIDRKTWGEFFFPSGCCYLHFWRHRYGYLWLPFYFWAWPTVQLQL